MHGLRDLQEFLAETVVALQDPTPHAYLEEGLDKHADDEAQECVMAGSAAILEETEISERVAWTKGAMERLDEAVPDPEARCHIVSGCAHRFPEVLIDEMR